MRIFPIMLLALTLTASAFAAELVPPVQEISEDSGSFQLTGNIAVETVGEVQNEANLLREYLAAHHGVTLAQGTQPVSGGRRIVLAIRPASDEVPSHAEGYLLRIAPSRIDLNATTSAGIYYGLLTLKQLMAQANNGTDLSACTIRDWPDLDWRAAFLNLRFVASGEEQQQKLHDLIRGFAALKYNKLFIEISDNYNYENWTWPNRATPAFDRDNLTALAAVARQHHIELIPYLQTISHTLWIRSNTALWEELKEGDTVKMWDSQYCPSNPRAVQLVHDVIAEQIEILKPRYFHVGLDEAWEGPFGTCPVCKTKDHVELYRESVMTIFDQLIDAGVRPIAYNDGFNVRTGVIGEHPPHGWKVIDQIPREVIIHAWDYSADLGESFDKELQWFSDKGFDVLGASYQRPRNVLSMPGQVKQNPRGLGVILTYWYDVESWEKFDTISPHAWATTTLSAIASWKVAAADPQHIRGDLIAPLQLAIAGNAIERDAIQTPVDLSPYFNASFGGDKGAIPGRPIAHALTEMGALAEYAIADSADRPNAIVLSGQAGDGLPVAPVTISLNRRVDALSFVHTCDRPFSNDVWNIDPNSKTQKPTIGRYRIRFADGKEDVVELRYNWNIVDWNAPFSAFASTAVYRGKADDGSNFVVTRHVWKNPRPDNVVDAVTMESDQNDGLAPVLLALNAVADDQSALVIDTFDSSAHTASAGWRFLQDPDTGPARAVVVSEADGRHGVLQVQMPPAPANSSSRVMLDIPVKVPEGARQISFWLHLGDPQALGQSGVYVGNENFAKSAGLFRVARVIGGWQQVIVSLESLKAIDPAEVTWMRISLWNKPQQPASTIYIDDVLWQKQVERPADAVVNWHE